MRILHICAYTWAIGGPAKMIFDHTRVHAAQGHQITILTPVSAEDVVYETAPGVRVVPVPRHPLSRFFPEFSPELWRYLRRHGNDFDLIHVHGLWHFGSLAPYLLKLKPPKILTIHGLLDRWAIRQGRWKKELLSWLGQRRWLRQTPVVHVNNEQERDDIRRYLGEPHPNVVIVSNGLRPADFAHLPPRGRFRAEFGIGPDERVILFLSRLNVKKGLDVLLPAFRRLSHHHPDLRLVLAGPDDGCLAQIDHYVRQHRLDERVLLPGLLIGEQKLAAYADADLYALPTYSESFAIAALEALAAGVPSLLTEHVGYGKLLRAYEAAQVCEPTEQSVYDGLAHLLNNPNQAARLAQNARRMIAAECDIDVLANRLLAAYELAVRQPASVAR